MILGQWRIPLELGILARERLKLRFLVLLAILSNHKIHHIYLNLAVLLTCMMYYMGLRNVEYYQSYHSYFWLRVHDMYPLGQNVEGTILEGTWNHENSDS